MMDAETLKNICTVIEIWVIVAIVLYAAYTIGYNKGVISQLKLQAKKLIITVPKIQDCIIVDDDSGEKFGFKEPKENQ